ncbi:MAG: hypothetical protein ACK4U0_15700 [Mesorhizobium sp.]
MAIKWRPGKTPNNKGNVTSLRSGDAIDGEILSPESIGDLATNDSARDFISDARARMGLLAKFNFDRHSQRELRRVSGEIAVNYLNAQKEVMLDKIGAAVALEKRSNLRQFLSVAIDQDKELRLIADNAEKEMANLIEREVVIVLEEKKSKMDDAEARFRDGRLLEDDYSALKDMHTQVAEKLIVSKFDRMAKISESYVERFEQALQGYKERFVDYKSVF